MKAAICFLLLSVSALSARGQLLDTIRANFEHKPKFFFKLDSRNSFVTSRAARVMGVKLGWDYNNSLRIGIGFNWLASNHYKEKVLLDKNNEPYISEADLFFIYFSPFAEYVFFRNKKWEHAIPVQVGFGNSWFQYEDINGRTLREKYKPVILYEPAMTTQYKVLPWFGIGAGVGYRLLLLNNKASGENLNSPVYLIRFRLFFGDLYRGIFKKKEQKKG